MPGVGLNSTVQIDIQKDLLKKLEWIEEMSIMNFYKVLLIQRIFFTVIIFVSGLNTNEQLILYVYSIELKDNQTNYKISK